MLFRLILVLAIGYIVTDGMGLIAKAHGAELNETHIEYVELNTH